MNPLTPDIQHRIATDRQLDLLREADEGRLARVASTRRATGRAASPGTSQPGEVGDPAPTGWLSGLRLIGRRVPRGL
jgi:hypothetical protein